MESGRERDLGRHDGREGTRMNMPQLLRTTSAAQRALRSNIRNKHARVSQPVSVVLESLLDGGLCFQKRTAVPIS